MRMRSSVFSTCCPRPLGNLGSPDQSVSHQNCCTLSMDWALLILSRVRTPEVRLQAEGDKDWEEDIPDTTAHGEHRHPDGVPLQTGIPSETGDASLPDNSHVERNPTPDGSMYDQALRAGPRSLRRTSC